MNFRPAMGSYFLTPVDEILSGKTEVGFGGKTDKSKPEVPYKFRIAGVGGPVPFSGVMVYPEFQIGDIVSSNETNSTFREQKDSKGFIIDGVWYFPVDFRDILGIWETNEEREQKATRILDACAVAMRGMSRTGLSQGS
jgi:hypothetical protein